MIYQSKQTYMVQRREASPGTWSGVRSIKILSMKTEMYKIMVLIPHVA